MRAHEIRALARQHVAERARADGPPLPLPPERPDRNWVAAAVVAALMFGALLVEVLR